jgi:hypothetical protein
MLAGFEWRDAFRELPSKQGGIMILCDLCGRSKECLQKEIDGREYDICAECWNPLAEKLKGKGRGRTKRERETVVIPPLTKEPEPPAPQPPGEPPKIWGEGRHMRNPTRI